MSTATSQPPLDPSKAAAKAALAGTAPDNNPAANPPQPPPAAPPESKENSRQQRAAQRQREEFEELLGKMPSERARKVFEERFKDVLPKPKHNTEQLRNVEWDLRLGCDLLKELTAAVSQRTSPKAEQPTATKPTGGPQRRTSSGPEPPTPTLPASPPPIQPAPTPSLGTRLLSWWKPALIVAAVIVPTIIAIILISGVRFGGQGSSGGTPSKPANIKFDF